MSFHKGYILGLFICFVLSSFLICYFYPKAVSKACNPVINVLDSCLEQKQVLASTESDHKTKKEFEYKYLFDKILNNNFDCSNNTYLILTMDDDKQKRFCLSSKYETFLGIKNLGPEVRYDYLYDLKDGIYILGYKTDTMSFLTLAEKKDFDKLYNKNGDILIFTNPKYDLNIQKDMFENEILKYLSKYNFTLDENILTRNQTSDMTLYCLEMNYPFLNPDQIGKETIKEIVYDVLINRNYLSKINEKMNIFALNINYKDKLYNIKICFGLDEFKNVFNNNTINAQNIKELSGKLKGKNDLETAYNVLKWVDKNIKYDDKKSKDVIENRNPKLRTPEEVFKDKKGICSEYSMFIDAILLNDNVTPYYIIIKYKNKDIDHAVAAIKYNNTYYILDQHLPLIDLNHYIISSHICDNNTFKEITIYRINKNFNKEIIKKITRFNYITKNNSLKNLEKDLIKKISEKYNIKFVENLFKNDTIKIKKGIIKEFGFHCLYSKLGSKGLEYFDSKYLLEEIIDSTNKELSVAKYFDLSINVEKDKDIKIAISLGY